MDDGFEMQLLGGEKWKALGEVKPHLIAEHGQRAGARAVFLAHASAPDMRHEIEILLHAIKNTAILFQSDSLCASKGQIPKPAGPRCLRDS